MDDRENQELENSHVLDRPRIPTMRRRPTTVRLELEHVKETTAHLEEDLGRNKENEQASSPDLEINGIKSNRKWAAVLGLPRNEKERKRQHDRFRKVAKRRGASSVDVEFILEHTQTPEEIENRREMIGQPLDCLQARLLRKACAMGRRSARTLALDLA